MSARNEDDGEGPKNAPRAEQRIVIVGAGPAGARAAEMLAGAFFRPIVIDEAAAAGGWIYRQETAGSTGTYWSLYGFEARKAQRLHESFQALGDRIDYRPSTRVWNIQGKVVQTVRDGVLEDIGFDALILATGATDLLLPFQGWTRPGVFSLGEAQVELKHRGGAVGRKTIFLGTGPLLYVAAYEYVRAGAKVAAVLDTAPLKVQLRASPGLL